jgi:hypothetical protein
MYIGLHVKYRYCCQILIKLEFSEEIFDKSSNVQFDENPSNESRVVPFGQRDGQTDGHDEANKNVMFSPSTSVFPCQFHSTGAPLLVKIKKKDNLSSSSQG